MVKLGTTLALIASVACLAEAKELTTVDGRKTRTEHPEVGAGINDDLCFFKNYDDSWCIAATPPMVKAGWEWQQTFSTTSSADPDPVKYYQLQWKPYLQMQANLISTLFLQNIWVNVLTFDVDQFKANFFTSLIINEDFGFCPGFGFETQKILLRILYTMKFWDCKKTIVSDLADFSSTWTGYEAKYFEDCSQSNNAEVIFYEKEIVSEYEEPWAGTIDAKSAAYCIYLFGTANASYDENGMVKATPAQDFSRMAFKNFANWAVTTYPGSFN